MFLKNMAESYGTLAEGHPRKVVSGTSTRSGVGGYVVGMVLDLDPIWICLDFLGFFLGFGFFG